MEYKLELVTIPVNDVDRAKDFYENKAGFRRGFLVQEVRRDGPPA